MIPFRAFAAGALLALITVAPARGQRPLRTEDPEPLPAGQVAIEAGAGYEWDRGYPASGLRGDLVRLIRVGFRAGLGGLAEFQGESGYNRLRIEGQDPDALLAGELRLKGDTTGDIEDPVIATKIRLREETALTPAVALRVATRLPSAGNDSGLGLDTFDFHLQLLAGKSLGATRLVGNFGLGVLAVPERGDRQNDVLLYGASLARPVGAALTLVGEVNGRVDVSGGAPIGTEDRGEARLGARWARGRVQLDGVLLAGLYEPDPDVGVELGATYFLQAD
ncbi:MAG: hypothetical protein ABR559_01435 [Gemmatimonadota bacterium]